MLEITASILVANGRAASAVAWARRSLEAATICMALVIFCVALVEAMRTRMSFKLAIAANLPSSSTPSPHPRGRGDQNRACARSELSKRLGVTLDHRLQLAGGVVREIAGLADAVEDVDILAAQERQQAVLESAHLVERERVEIAVGAGPDHADLLFHLQRRELRLLEEFGQTRTAIQQALRRGVEIAAELRERRHFAVLRQLALDLAGDLLHRLGLRRGSAPRPRQTDVHRRPDALEEQVGFQEDLAVGDRNDVGRNV